MWSLRFELMKPGLNAGVAPLSDHALGAGLKYRFGEQKSRTTQAPSGPQFGRIRRISRQNRALLRWRPSFRDGPKDQTRNLEILRCARAHQSSVPAPPRNDGVRAAQPLSSSSG